MRHLSLFTGIGGLDLGFERAGMTTVGQVEIDPFCVQVLRKHWPDVWRWEGDIRDCNRFPEADVISAGFPCQPTSLAGLRQHRDDERWLWPEVERVVGLVRPQHVVVENPTGILTLGFGDITSGLAALGYDFTWEVLSACAFGAPHTRERVFIMAHRQNGIRSAVRDGSEGSAARREPGRTDRPAAPGTHWDVPFAGVLGVADGFPAKVDRHTALGNAVVPQVAECVGRRIINASV